jgi:hypothetical protein
MKKKTLVALLRILFYFITALFVKHLWNYIMPTLFDLPLVTYWQALFLKALFELLSPSRYSKDEDSEELL